MSDERNIVIAEVKETENAVHVTGGVVTGEDGKVIVTENIETVEE